MFFSSSSWCLIIGILFFHVGLQAQTDELDYRHFTTDHGLPSSEVYTVLEDREGYIWVGTDNGGEKQSTMNVTPLFAANGKPAGTVVELTIRPVRQVGPGREVDAS